MGTILGKVIVLIIILVIAFIAIGLLITYSTQHSAYQNDFTKGTLPNPAPDGFYKGTSLLPIDGKSTWLGKTFLAKSQNGWNAFQNNIMRYHFKTSVGLGLQDATLQTFKLDYNLPENPWYLRILIDEMVQINPTTYLGKIHLRIIPGLPFSVGYFRLEKPQEVGGCVVSGCSRELCSDKPLFSVCNFKAEFQCYRTALCQRQKNGTCGWNQSPDLTQCIIRTKTNNKK